MQVAGLDRHLQSDLRDVFISAEERENGENIAIEATERTEEERRSEGASPEANPVRKPVKEEMTVEGRREDGLKIEKILERNQGSKQGKVPPLSSLPPTPYAKVSPQFLPLAVTSSNPTVSTAAPSEVRVVQCSDKGVDKVPYGIPYNARYILLMNNHINSIQLDLLNEYVSMEFLVLSNNLLTDGAIEGAFEGVPALKRLYLDRNLLESVPTDLPFSLEELRLDNNQLGVMSQAAWARCPGLLVLSLSNNSLGNGSESLPNAVLSPLYNLRTLNLDYNQLTSVPLGLPLSIKELYLKGNLIEQFRGGAFNGISELVVLDLSANRLTNKGLLRESLLNATHLESLNLEGNRLKQVPRHLPRSLKTLNLEGNLISSIKKAAFSTLKNLEHLGLARNKIFKVAIGAFRTLPILHQLDLCHNTLRQMPRQLPQGLHSVALTHNKIQSVPRDAFCWGNRSLSLSGLVRVQLEHNLIDMGKLDAQAFRCLRGFQVVHFY
ncbi:nuclear receptor corepressor 2 [Lates japonicus]|uniref:Nuclear receptor corepressor 2 n=1 Tax=Lates japonicus TaxID=270547 RepID=A0AAD3QXV8_LATJO|nr:nuclear receptor corepressor 2 [Lates japonicus]